MSPFLSLYCYLETRVHQLDAQREEGAVAIEYALLATLIAIAIILAVTGVGTRLIAKFNAITF